MGGESSGDSARFRLLYDLGCAFAARVELDELLPFVAAKCREVFDADGVSVILLDPERQELYFPYVAERDPEVVARLTGLRFPADRGIAGAVLQSAAPLRVDDVQSDPRFYGGVDRRTGVVTRALLAAPLRSAQGTIGVIQVVNPRGRERFTDDELAFLDALAGSVAVAVENARMVARLKESEALLRAEVGALRSDLARRGRFTEMIGTGAEMEEVFRLMESAAASPIAVLIEGETGTGKELVARGIHSASPRAQKAFLAVNCAALPETLLESELFGHRRGSFTGAIADRRGLFEAAGGGTIFLDEIGEMSPAMQAKLLRVLQEGEVVPVGETRPRKVDVRVISATNRDLGAEVAARRFREDLYYRVAAFPIRLPPLRERREDIPLLAERFIAGFAERQGKLIRGIEPAALDLLVAFDWPGNVRELENEIERAIALTSAGERIAAAQLSGKLTARRSGAAAPSAAPLEIAEPGATALRDARAAFERRHIRDVLDRHHGNVSRTADALGISRVALQKKMKQYGLR